MPAYITLKVGESYTLKVSRVEEVSRGKWPEYDFHGMGPTGPTIVTAPKAASDRQLEKHLTMTLAQLVGQTLTISRTPSDTPNRSWWNLDLATPAALKPQPPSKRLPPPPAEHDLPGDPAAPYNDDEAPTAPLSPTDTDLLDAIERAKEEQTASVKRVVKLYLGLWEQVATHQVAFGQANNFPVDGVSINAAAATIFIELNKRQLLK